LVVLAAAWLVVYAVNRAVYGRKKGETGSGDGIGELSMRIYPLMLLVRSRSVIKPLDKIADAVPRLWDGVSRAAVATGFGLMLFAVFTLSNNLSTYLFRPEQVTEGNIVVPLIVGVTIRLDHLPYLLIAFAAVLLTHEGMHGVIARREGLPVKSAGIFLVFILPGGFVEPDEQAFKTSRVGTRVRVAAVGSFANLVLGLATLLIVFTFFVPGEAGLIIIQTEEGSRLSVNDVLVSMDGIPVNSYTVRRVNITIGETLTVKTLDNEYVFQTNPGVRGMQFPLGSIIRGLGVSQVDSFFQPRIAVFTPPTSYAFYKTLYWVWFVSIGVAVFNMLPIYMLDGYIVVRSVLEKFVKNPRRLAGLANAISLACIGLVVSNVAFTYSFFGFFQI